jgi:hypothetical protein
MRGYVGSGARALVLCTETLLALADKFKCDGRDLALVVGFDGL